MLAPPLLWRQIALPERRRRLWLWQVAYVAILSMMFALIWPRGGRVSAQVLEQSANAFLTWLLWVQAGLFCLVAPPLVAASITIEREQGSLDLLLLSPMGTGAILVTKCLTQLYSIGVIFLSGVPIFMLGLFMGGLAPDQLFWCVVILAGLGLLACSAGALSGALFSSTAVAMLGGYVILGLTVGVIPLVLSYLWRPAWYLLSPFGMVGTITGATTRPLWATYGHFVHVGCWLGLALALLIAAAKALGRGRAGEMRKPRRVLGTDTTVWKELRIPRERLIAWREMRGRSPSCSPVSLALVLVLFGSIGLLDFLLWQNLMDPSTNLAATLALCVTTLALALFMSTSSMVNERRRGDLELLVMTRLEPREIIRGKFNGILTTISPFLLLPFIQGCFGPFPWCILTALLACLVLYAMVPAAILAGIESGMRCPELSEALARAVRRWTLLLLVISAKFLLALLIPILCVLSFFVVGVLSLFVVFLIFRFANDYLMGPVIDNYLASQFAKGGADTEWHGEDWEIGRVEIVLATVLWAAVGLFVAFYSGKLIGVFVLFLLGAGVAVAAVYGVLWLVRKYRERYGLADAPRGSDPWNGEPLPC